MIKKPYIKIFFALLVFLLATTNTFYRLSYGKIEEWDEARNGVTAFEMLKSGNYIVSTYLGENDYWNLKPPLGFWLIAGSYRISGTSTFALRFPSALCALLSVFVVALIGAKKFGYYTGLTGAAILTTTFPFIIEHSARAGENDAPLALLVALTILVINACRAPWIACTCLGSLLAVVFLLKSFSVAIPLIIIAVWLIAERPKDWSVEHVLVGLFVAAGIVGVWVVFRYQADGLLFFKNMIEGDLANRSLNAIEEHHKGFLFYPMRIINKNVWWAICTFALLALSLRRIAWKQMNIKPNLLAWALAPILIASVMQTKLPWYINSAYPGLALLLAVFVSQVAKISFKATCIFVALAFLSGEIRIIDKINKNQVLPQDEQVLRQIQTDSTGGKIAATSWSQAQRFVAIVEKRLVPAQVDDLGHFIRSASNNDLVFSKRAEEIDNQNLTLIGETEGYSLYRVYRYSKKKNLNTSLSNGQQQGRLPPSKAIKP